MKKILKYSLILFLIGSLFIFGVNLYIYAYSKDKLKDDINSIENGKVGLVLGARVYKNGQPSLILKDRLNVAFNAYEKGIIKKIILSGDNRFTHYNEPVNMEKYLVGLGVNKNDIYLNYAGFDTYDSLYRAKEIFGAKETVVFTQNFHQYRSIYIGNRLGMKTYGIGTDLNDYLYMKRNNIREVGARIKAFFDVEILKSKPKFLGEKISLNKIQTKVY